MNHNDGEGSNVEADLRKRLEKCEAEIAQYKATIKEALDLIKYGDPHSAYLVLKGLDAARAALEAK